MRTLLLQISAPEPAIYLATDNAGRIPKVVPARQPIENEGACSSIEFVWCDLLDAVSFVLKKAGTIEYYCRYHPNMKGRIVTVPK